MKYKEYRRQVNELLLSKAWNNAHTQLCVRAINSIERLKFSFQKELFWWFLTGIDDWAIKELRKAWKERFVIAMLDDYERRSQR